METTVLTVIITAGIPALVSLVSIIVPIIRDRKHGWTSISKDMKEIKDTMNENRNSIEKLNGRINNLEGELKQHKEHFESHITEDAEMRVSQLRSTIINFNSRVNLYKAGKDDTLGLDEEIWKTAIGYIDVYNKMCEKHKIPNGVLDASIKNILGTYATINFTKNT